MTTTWKLFLVWLSIGGMGLSFGDFRRAYGGATDKPPNQDDKPSGVLA